MAAIRDLFSARAYNDAAVIRELKKRLVVPSGLALIWWNVRTNFTDSAKVKRRFQALRRAVGELERLARLNYPISGFLTANISLHGSQLSPTGQGSIQFFEAART
jgi:hypothetical protein